MTIDTVTAIANDALFLILKLSMPVLLVSLVVGLVISIFQTVTSIQEQTLTFIPKIIAVFVALMIFGHWIMSTLVNYMNQLWDFSLYVNK